MKHNEFKNFATFGEKKIDVTKEFSAGVSCGIFCRPFDIINSAANEIKSLGA